MSMTGSPLGLSSAVQAVLAYPKSAITIAACCAAFATMRSGGPYSEILNDPVCIESENKTEAEGGCVKDNIIEETPILATSFDGIPNDCPVKEVVYKPPVIRKPRPPGWKPPPRKPTHFKKAVKRAPILRDDCGNPIVTTY